MKNKSKGRRVHISWGLIEPDEKGRFTKKKKKSFLENEDYERDYS